MKNFEPISAELTDERRNTISAGIEELPEWCGDGPILGTAWAQITAPGGEYWLSTYYPISFYKSDTEGSPYRGCAFDESEYPFDGYLNSGRVYLSADALSAPEVEKELKAVFGLDSIELIEALYSAVDGLAAKAAENPMIRAAIDSVQGK